MPDPRHLAALLRLAPKGSLDLDEGTTLREDYAVAGGGLDTAEIQQRDLLTETRPQAAVALLPRWESLYRLRSRGYTLAQRLARLIARVRLIPNFTPASIEARVEQYTVCAWTLTESGPFRCNQATSVCDDPDDVVDGGLVFILQATRTAANAAGVRRDDLQTFVGDLQPAHTVAVIRFDDFRVDDPYSLTDRDLLGA